MARSDVISTSTPSSESSKSRAQPQKKITRNRPITSCSECTRRKQKCSKNWPCTFCLGRKSPHLCNFVNNKKDARANDDGFLGEKMVEVGRETEKHATAIEKEVQDVARQRSDDGEEYDLKVDSNEMVVGTFKDNMGDTDTQSSKSVPAKSNPLSLSHEEVMNMMPDRDVADALIQHFLAQVNWLAEEIHAPTFLSKYHKWWTISSYAINTEVQFGILILRLCVNSIQYLPHATGPTHPSLQTFEQLDKLERRCTNAASELSELKRSRPNIMRIQHLLFHIVTLLNNGNAKESYKALEEAVREGQEIFLYIEAKWKGLTEFEMEERRRVFWYLYVWDRFHCTYLGRWPLIPDNYHSVSYPSEKPYMVSPLLEAPTQFTDVFFNFKMCRHMVSITSAPLTAEARSDPFLISKAAEAFETEFLNICPPCLRFGNPDLQWDNLIPTLAMKRQALYIMSYGTVIAMHKCFIGPLAASKVAEYVEKMSKSQSMMELTRVHRRTFANACIKTIAASLDLLKLMGYGQSRWFVLSVASIEATANLALLITAENLLKAASAHGTRLPTLDTETHAQCHEYFEKGLEMHHLLSTRSPLAQKGTQILRSLERRIRNLSMLEGSRGNLPIVPKRDNTTLMSQSALTMDTAQSTIDLDFTTIAQDDSHGNALNTPYTSDNVLQTVVSDDAFLGLDWAAICAEGDYSWFFDSPFEWNLVTGI